MGLKFEAFFILISKGGGLKATSYRPCKTVGQPSPQGTRKW